MSRYERTTLWASTLAPQAGPDVYAAERDRARLRLLTNDAGRPIGRACLVVPYDGMDAAPWALRRVVLGQALAVAGTGAAVGLLGAWGASRLARAVLYEVRPADPLALAGALALLVGVALAAAYAPARRATRIDPASALRAE